MSRFAILLLALVAAPALAGSRQSSIPEVPTAPAEARVDHRAEWESYLRTQRQTQFDRLAQYSANGSFPLNMDQKGFAHQLLDKNGTPCAMAYLFIQSGEGDLITETARKHNDLVMADQASGPFADWIVTSGLTREEVAIIQEPGFEWNPELDAQYAEIYRMQTHFQAALGLLAADTEPSIALALDRLGERVYELPPGSVAAL